MNTSARRRKLTRRKAETAKGTPAADPGWHGLRDPWTLLLLVPLITLLPILNVRIFPFVAPNEEPKWAVLVICGLLMGLSWVWALWKAGSLRIRPGAAGLLLAAFLLLLAAGIPVGPNPIEGLIRFSFWLIAAAVLVLAAWAMRTRKGWLDWLSWATSVASIVFSLGYWYGYVMKFGKPGYNVSVLFSPIGHVNFTGDVLVVLLPAVIWMLARQRNPILRVLNWFSVMTMATVLLVAAGRGAIGGLLVGSLVLLAVATRHWLGFWREGRRPAVAPSVWVISALLVAVIVNAMLPYHYRELVRVSGTLEAAVEEKSARELDWSAPQPPFASFWAATYPVLTTRTPMYASATAMALDAPWLGQGTGNFPFVYPAWSNRFPDFRDPLSTERTFTTNPHNIILQLASQNGFPATLIFLGLLGMLWFRLVRALWREWNGWHAAGVAAITAAIFDAMFNHVFYNPASMFVFALFAGSWWGAITDSTPAGEAGLSIRWTRPLALAMAIVSIVLAVWPLRWVASEWHVGQAMAHANQPRIAKVEYEQAYALDPYNFRAVFGMAQARYTDRKFDDAVAYLKDFERIYPYNPPALNMLGAAYMMKGEIDQAEKAFKRAIRVLPGFEMALQNLQRLQMVKAQRRHMNGKAGRPRSAR